MRAIRSGLLIIGAALGLFACGRAPTLRPAAPDRRRVDDAFAAVAGRVVAREGGIPLLRRLALPIVSDQPSELLRQRWRSSVASVVPLASVEAPLFVGVAPAQETEIGLPNQEFFVDDVYLVRISFGLEGTAGRGSAAVEIRCGPAPASVSRLPYVGP